MKISDIKCNKCRCGIISASKRGAYLKRVNPTGAGVAPISECSPSCEHKTGGPNDALLGAILKNN